MSNIHNIAAEGLKIEESVIKEVLEQHLKREPTLEDAKKCKRLFRLGVINSYTLAYDGVSLGQITKSIIDFRFKVDFKPIVDIWPCGEVSKKLKFN